MNWKLCLRTCRRVLGAGDWNPFLSQSWCAFTTFSSIKHGVHYWECGFPEESECLDTNTEDGGLWRQSFMYDDLAHLIVPASFYWENVEAGEFHSGLKRQDLELLSSELGKLNIQHRKTELVLEIKLF
jgi:hypothetical protein